MKIITRKDYAERIDAWLGKEQIIVLVGQRRVGKSFVMKDFVARHKEEPDSNIIYIDKEKKAFNFIRNYEPEFGINSMCFNPHAVSLKGVQHPSPVFLNRVRKTSKICYALV